MFPVDGRTKDFASIDIYSETSLTVYLKIKPGYKLGKVACSSILKASFTDYTLRLLISKDHILDGFFF